MGHVVCCIDLHCRWYQRYQQARRQPQQCDGKPTHGLDVVNTYMHTCIHAYIPGLAGIMYTFVFKCRAYTGWWTMERKSVLIQSTVLYCTVFNNRNIMSCTRSSYWCGCGSEWLEQGDELLVLCPIPKLHAVQWHTAPTYILRGFVCFLWSTDSESWMMQRHWEIREISFFHTMAYHTIAIPYNSNTADHTTLLWMSRLNFSYLRFRSCHRLQ